jgi:hypothetical protein
VGDAVDQSAPALRDRLLQLGLHGALLDAEAAQPLLHLVQGVRQRLADAVTGLTAKLSALIQRIRQSLGGPGSNQTAAQRLATYQLALQLVQLISQIGPGPSGG